MIPYKKPIHKDKRTIPKLALAGLIKLAMLHAMIKQKRIAKKEFDIRAPKSFLFITGLFLRKWYNNKKKIRTYSAVIKVRETCASDEIAANINKTPQKIIGHHTR